jgi:transcriptional regulator with XRE-family HTH domain
MPSRDDERSITGRLLLGARVRELRTEQGLRLSELAARAGMSQAYLSEVERGRQFLTLPGLDAVARALDIAAADLLDGVYPWGSDERPREQVTPAPDGRAASIRVRRQAADE